MIVYSETKAQFVQDVQSEHIESIVEAKNSQRIGTKHKLMLDVTRAWVAKIFAETP